MQSRQIRAYVFIISVVILVPVSSAHALVSSSTPYLQAHEQSPWVVMALAGAGETPDTTFLKSASGTTAIELEAPILALTAMHEDPRTYPQSDLVQALESYYKADQIGDPTTLNDDIFGVLALVSAGVLPQEEIVASTSAYIEANQNKDGGWPFVIDGTSDTNTTAAAIMALIASGIPASDAHIVLAVAYLHAAQNPDGGLPYDPKSQWGTSSDASSDAWAILALTASGIDASAWTTASGTPLTDLLSYQMPDGYFEFQHGSGEDAFSPVTTSYAVLALLGKTLPVATLPAPDLTAPVISDVSAGSISQTAATITWDTNEPSSAQVIFGADANYGSTTTLDSSLITNHSVALNGLVAGTTYHFIVLSGDASGNLATSTDVIFETARTAVAGGSSGGGGGGIFGLISNFSMSSSANGKTAVSQGQVLGASTTVVASTTLETATMSENISYLFTYNLRFGMQGHAVAELQKELSTHGLLSVVAPTGWFGPLTLKAVKTFQKQNEIPTTGFVGPLTRTSLNQWK